MGISREQFEALANGTERFFIRYNDNEGSYDLVDRTTSEVVFNDAMEPEDAILPRDLFSLVELLNQIDGRDR